ncbi:MAG: glycine--tRNA ligase subunit beta, partial [Deferribacteraceae bacterium]|nr:glycine--tRNA ligase subunit beta [Deferribacteraceae bacterium]
MSFYLLEIGSEELPAGVVPMAANYVKTEAEKQLTALHLNYTTLKSGGTPRRVYLYIDGLPQRQADREERVQGPPAKLAFNADGSVSEVGLKFAQAKGLDAATLTKVSTDKGDYLSGVKKIQGEDTAKLLSEMATHIIKTIPFPKSMRWADRDIRFGRPLKYLLSIFDGMRLELGIEGFSAVDTTVGHRFLAPAAFKVTDFDSYIRGLKAAFVMVDEADRQASIRAQMGELAKKSGYELHMDEALLKTVSNLVEYPYDVEGVFEEAFLELPAPVLTTSMAVHQKYFPTYKDGKLQAKFIGISNMNPANGGSLISNGYARVLRARLNDALFFYNNDQKKPLESLVELLKKVTYQEKLGTSYEKMERFRSLARFIAGGVAKDKVALVERAATLAKADLMSEMVYEFPELQGFMGKVYAGLQGEDAEVAAAIEEHYMPRFAGDVLPQTAVGKIVAVADKLDTIVGAFAIDMVPTGNEDPYGLRRNAIGIINILEDSGWRIPLKALLHEEAIELIRAKATVDCDVAYDKIYNFFIQRHKQLLL